MQKAYADHAEQKRARLQGVRSLHGAPKTKLDASKVCTVIRAIIEPILSVFRGDSERQRNGEMSATPALASTHFPAHRYFRSCNHSRGDACLRLLIRLDPHYARNRAEIDSRVLYHLFRCPCLVVTFRLPVRVETEHAGAVILANAAADALILVHPWFLCQDRPLIAALFAPKIPGDTIT